jgi:exopolysaccharide biosynthesis polyprenyl glycosylphosphotransferase
MIYVEPTIRTGWRKLAKRAFDVAVASAMIVVTAPIILLAIVAIRLDSKGPLFFRQVRLGIDGREFKIIKLRTMVADAEQRKRELMKHNESDGPLFKMKRDPRVTTVGRFLRKTSIDELPQFWNVIRGDMSVVGPRPALPAEAEGWTDELHDRLRVLPGITGMWQVYGRAETTFDEYKRLDLYYVDNWSLFHDIRIVVRTVWVVLAGRGAA